MTPAPATPQPLFTLRSAASWQFAFLLLMLTAGYLSIAVSQIALGLALATMLYRWVVLKDMPPATGLEKTAALLALWALIMVPLSTNVPQSALYYRRFYLFAAIWVAAGMATNERRRLLLLVFLLAGALIITLYGQVQHFRQYGALMSQRLTLIYNAMTGGAMLMMAVQLVAGFVIVPGNRRRVKIVLTIVALPIILGIIMTMTRAAQLGLLVGLGSMLLLAKPRVFGGFLGLMVVAIVVLFFFGADLVPPKLWERINPEYIVSGNNTTIRLEMWRGGLEMVKAHPLTGVGDRGIAEIAPEYYTAENGEYFGHLHSNIVHMAVIWGIPGLIFGQVFLWTGLWLLIRRWRDLRQRATQGHGLPVNQAWVLGAIGVWVSFYIAGFTEWYFGDAEPMLIYFAILGCALGRGETEDSL